MTNDKDKLRELSPQEDRFCRAYGNPESETYGNATKSAEFAGYAQPHNAAWKVRHRPQIIARLQEMYDVATASLGKVMSDLEHERLLALKKGDLAAAIRASELQGKRLGAFLDRNVLAIDELQARDDYSDAERIEINRIADLLVLGHAALPLPLQAKEGDDAFDDDPEI